MKSGHGWMHRATSLACLLAAVCVRADVLELKNGQVLSGKYVGGTAGTIRFEAGGTVQVVEVGQALALTFAGETTPAPAVPPPPPVVPATPAPVAPVPTAPTAPPAVAPVVTGPLVIPGGTVLLVRMVDGVSSQDPAGKRFATTLETDLVVNNVVAVKAGTTLFGQIAQAKQAGRFAGSSTLDLRLRELMVGGATVPLMTGPYAQAGANSLKKTVGGAAAGALIGAAFDGSEGAGKGAAIGGVASGLKKGQAIVIPPGTLLEFRTLEQLSIAPPR